MEAAAQAAVSAAAAAAEEEAEAAAAEAAEAADVSSARAGSHWPNVFLMLPEEVEVRAGCRIVVEASARLGHKVERHVGPAQPLEEGEHALAEHAAGRGDPAHGRVVASKSCRLERELDGVDVDVVEWRC